MKDNLSAKRWHSIKEEELLKKLGSSREGLSSEEAQDKLSRHGENVLEERRRFSFIKNIWKQVKNPLALILVVAFAATLFLGENVDALVIFIALFVNIAIGVFQEGRASKAFEKLSSSQKKYATVLRNGEKEKIESRNIVPGDVIVIEQGDYVSADLRLLSSNELLVNEAVLTGESVSAEKDANKDIEEDTALADRDNMAWMGTVVSGGYGIGVVVATGEDTELGKIAESLKKEEESETPVQRNMKKLARFLSLIVLAVVVVIFILGYFRGEDFTTLLLLAIAIAVSVVPEGLPAAVTAVLAIGMEKILDKGGLVRNLLAAETLGGTTIILTDKTGTLTESKMSLKEALGREQKLSLKKNVSQNVSEEPLRLMTMGALASDAYIEGKGDNLKVRGRPLEKALLEAAIDISLDQRHLFQRYKRIDYIPFESKRRFEVSLHQSQNNKKVTVYSGSPETILKMSEKLFVGGQVKTLKKEDKEYFDELVSKKAESGMRFISIAYDEEDKENLDDFREGQKKNKNIVFVGVLAFEDPVRDDVPLSIRKAQKSGARVLMLTGDHPKTAIYVARKTGIATSDEEPLVGTDIEKMGDDELLKTIAHRSVYARMTPSNKLRIGKLLKREGEVIAMTGDGVNDAPALKTADIGIAVESGTEVAKEASDLILLKNSFSIIVAAIEEGRRIIDNLKKVVTHLLSTSFGEVFVIAGSMAFGLPLPILPVQILWVNIIEEGLLNFAFAFEPAEDDVMSRSPHSKRIKTVLTEEVKKLIMISGIVTGILILVLYLYLEEMTAVPISEIRTIIFASLSIDAIFFALSIKNLHRPITKIHLLSNPYLLSSLAVSIILLTLTLTVGPLQNLLSLVTLSSFGVYLLGLVAIFDIVTIETAKFFVFRNK